MGERPWTLRFVVDASPDDSLAVAHGLAAVDSRLAVTALPRNVGQNRALVAGLAASAAGAGAWVCLDADLQDPPEAVPALLDRLAAGDAGVVFAGRRGTYESRSRMVTGALHRAALARLTGLPPDAGAFLAMDRPSRDRLLALDPPGIVAGVGAAGIPCVSVPVERDARPCGRSAWTATARLGQSARSLLWAYRARSAPPLLDVARLAVLALVAVLPPLAGRVPAFLAGAGAFAAALPGCFTGPADFDGAVRRRASTTSRTGWVWAVRFSRMANPSDSTSVNSGFVPSKRFERRNRSMDALSSQKYTAP
jgi:polyisoprenyl-phosphate glycosyltransferase